MNCKQPDCKNKPVYNYEKGSSDDRLIGYCEKHKRPGMIRLKDECIIL